MAPRTRVASLLPNFPWDVLAPFGEQARSHAGGIVDLSVGTPVDPTPAVVQQALVAAVDSPGYPTVHGTLASRTACAGWLLRTFGAQVDPANVLPLIGTKEFVALLPSLLGLGPDNVVAIPAIAYPTYDVGVRIARARVVVADGLEELQALEPAPDLVWLNTPSNPTGRVSGVEELRSIVEWAQQRGIVLVSDECYAELGWTTEPISILDPRVCESDHTGLIALHSLSKRSNLAGYRFGFAAGDPALIAELLEVRKHIGLMVPSPVQAAAIAAYNDDAHVAEQKARYAARRSLLHNAFSQAGFRIDYSDAGLYLWATRDEPCWTTVEWLAARGILVAPGDFYGTGGNHHVRVALTATDERVFAAAERLT